MGKTQKRLWLGITIALLFGMTALAYLTVTIAQKAAEQRSQTLTVIAQDALDKSDFESAARFAMAAMRGHDVPLIGFNADKAEIVLVGAVVSSPALPGRMYFKHAVDALAYSPDGRHLATSSESDGIQVWDTGTHQLLASAPVPEGATVSWLKFTSDGHSLATNESAAWTIQPAAGGKLALSLAPKPAESAAKNLITEIQDSQQRIRSGDMEIYLATSPDEKTVLTAKGRVLNVWNVATHRMTTRDLTQIVELDHTIDNAWYSPNGKYVAVNSGTAILILDGKSLKYIGAMERLDNSQALWNAKFSPDGDRLAIMPDASTVQIYNTANMMAEGPAMRQIGTVQDVAFSPNGKTLAVAGGDWMVRFWDLTKGKPVRQQALPEFTSHGDVIPPSVYMPTHGDQLVIMDSGFNYSQWSLKTGARTGPDWPMEQKDSIHGARVFAGLSDDNAVMFLADMVGNKPWHITFVDTRTQADLPLSLTMPDGVYRPGLSADHRYLVAESGDDKIAVWDLKAPKLSPRIIKGDHSQGLHFTQDDKILQLFGYDGTTGKETVSYLDMATLKFIPATPELKAARDQTDILGGRIAIVREADDHLHMVTGNTWIKDHKTGARIGQMMRLGDSIETDIVANDHFIYTVSRDHVLRAYAVDPQLTLRGKALIGEACRRILPGDVSRFRDEELAHTPLLDQHSDGDVCRKIRQIHN